MARLNAWQTPHDKAWRLTRRSMLKQIVGRAAHETSHLAAASEWIAVQIITEQRKPDIVYGPDIARDESGSDRKGFGQPLSQPRMTDFVEMLMVRHDAFTRHI